MSKILIERNSKEFNSTSAKELIDKHPSKEEIIRSSWGHLLDNDNDIYKRELLVETWHPKPVFSGATFDNVVFPMVRRVFAQTVGQELVSVQPMELPTGMIHYMDYDWEPENLFKRKLLLERNQGKKEEYYRPNYLPIKFVSPGVYTREYDITVVPPADIRVGGIDFGNMAPPNPPTLIENDEQFRHLFGTP